MHTKMRVLVTGANGLLGTNTIIELLNQGHEVVGFLRDKNSFVGGNHKNLKLIEGDILNPKDLASATMGCEYVIHSAAITDPNHLGYSEYEMVNVKGTKNVIEEAVKAGVKKLIFVSTANIFGFGTLNQLGNESKEIREPFSKSFYSISKKEAQDYALSMKDKIEIVIVNPSFMIGAFDSKPSSGKIILMGYKKRILLCPPGGKNFVCVTDVSKGIIKAIKQGINGETYLFTNENLSFKEFFNLMNKHTGSKPIFITLPKVFLLGLGGVGSFLRTLGINTAFSIENMKILCINSYYSNDKAKAHLGATFNSIEAGISEAINWFEQNKYL